MSTTLELTKGEIGMIISALHLWRMEYDTQYLNEQKKEFIEKLDNLTEKFIEIVEVQHEQINLLKIIDNQNKR